MEENYFVEISGKCAGNIASNRNSLTQKSLELNGVAERALGIIQNAAFAARIQAPILFPHVQLPPLETLWAEAVHWACEALNRTAKTSNPGNKSPYDMWHGKAAPASPHPFLRPGYGR